MAAPKDGVVRLRLKQFDMSTMKRDRICVFIGKRGVSGPRAPFEPRP